MPQPEPDLERTYFWIHNTTPDETNGVINAVSCYKMAVQFNASFFVTV